MISITAAITARDDLALLPWTRPSLIGTKLLPTMEFFKKQDVIVYAPVRDESLVAQTGRSMGKDFDLNLIPNVRQAIDLTATEIAFTDQKDLSDVVELSDLEVAMKVLAYQGKPVVAYMLEAKIAKAFLDGKAATATTTEKEFINTIRATRQAISAKLADGQIVLAMSQTTYNKVVMMDEVQKQIGKGVSMPYSADMSAANIQRLQVASIFGVDQVLVGQNKSWEASSIVAKGGVIVACIPNPNIDPKLEVQLGRTACFTKYMAAPTPADGATGQQDYDAAVVRTGNGANKEYATPFNCLMWPNAKAGSVALTIQTFSLPYIFNADLYEVVAPPATASI